MSPMSEKHNFLLVLQKNHLFCVENFSYLIGDCLFDNLELLLDFRYTSIELRKGTIEYFRDCLGKQDSEAILSYEHELHEASLKEMHNISNREIYLDKMARSASNNIPLASRGLWGDILCIHWLSNWLKIPVRVWSKTNMRVYLHFNSSVTTNTRDILFHDEDTLNGHFKPLVPRQPTIDRTFQQQTDISKNNTEPQLETKCQSIEAKLKPSCHLNKHKRSVSFHWLQDISPNNLKRQRIGIGYNKITMKQQVVLENIEDVSDCHLNKHKRSLSLHVLKDIGQKNLKRQKTGIQYKKSTMEQQVVLENTEDVSDTPHT